MVLVGSAAMQTAEQKLAAEAALAQLKQIANVAAERSRMADVMTADDLLSTAPLRIELDSVKKLLALYDDFAPITDVFNKLFPPVRPLPPRPAAQQGAASPTPEQAPRWGMWVDHVGTLVRLLEARLVILAGLLESQTAALNPPASPEGTAPQPDPAHVEGLVVARATERLFGSTQVKAMATALGVAMVVACGSGVFVATESYLISKELRGTAEAAGRRMEDLAASAKASADAQARTLEATRMEIAAGKADLERGMEGARQGVQQQAAQARAELAALKDDAMGEVVAKVRADLDRDSQPLVMRVEAVANEVATRLKSLEAARLPPLEARLGALSDGVAADEQRWQAQRASFAELDRLARRVDEIAASVGSFERYGQAIAAAQTAADSARIAADAAKAHRDTVAKSLETLDQGVSSQLVQYGTLKQRLDSLGEMVATIQPSLCDQPSLESNPWALKAQIACIKQRVLLLEQQSPAGGSSQDAGEPRLSKGEWMRVQRALARLQVYHGKVDGDPGREHATPSRTRAAIREWQRGIGESPTGQLTQAQVQMLIGAVQTAG